MTSEREDNRRGWHVGREVPLAVIVAFVVQTLVGTWWMSSFAERTAGKLDNLEVRQKALDALPERMVRQEGQIEAAVAMLKDIKNDMRDVARKASK